MSVTVTSLRAWLQQRSPFWPNMVSCFFGGKCPVLTGSALLIKSACACKKIYRAHEVINICVKIYFTQKPCHFCWALLLVEIISFWFVLLERTNFHVCEKTVELKHHLFIYSSTVLWNRHLVLLGSHHATSVAAISFLATKEKQLRIDIHWKNLKPFPA